MSDPAELLALSRTKRVRRDRLLASAERLFSRIGLRAATMEAIAEEAQVSKATLYAYFPDKMAVFTAVAERLAAQMREGVASALAGDGRLADRVANALLAKHGRAFDVVIGTPNAAELMDARRHEVGAIFAATDQAIEDAIRDALSASASSTPAATARLIFRASIGISEHATARTELEEDIRRLVEVLINGALMTAVAAGSLYLGPSPSFPQPA